MGKSAFLVRQRCRGRHRPGVRLKAACQIQPACLTIPQTWLQVPQPSPRKARKRLAHLLTTLPYRASPEALAQLQVGHLSEKQRKEFDELINEFADVFAASKDDLGRTKTVEHRINLQPDAQPVKQRPYTTNPEKTQFIEEEIERMKALGIIVESDSPWASPVVVVGKKTGDYRFCVDFRRLNELTIKDAYPLPKIERLINMLRGAHFFSSLDLQSGFWQVGMAEEDQEKTAFVTEDGLFHFTVMPFGLTNAPATFQRLMDKVLQQERKTCVVVFIDDINVHSPSWEQHLLDLRKVFERLRAAGLCLNIKKCKFCQPELSFLGYVVSRDGVATDPAKVEKMVNFPVPRTPRNSAVLSV